MICRSIHECWYNALEAFTKSRKATVSFGLSLCPSVCPHGKTRLSLDGFSSNLIFEYFFLNLSRKFKFHQNITKTMGTLHEDQHTVSSYHTLFFLQWKSFQEKIKKKIKTAIPFFHSCAVHSDAIQCFISPTNAHQYCSFSEAQTASSLMKV